MSDDGGDFFASLGGSLMKDLLADLAVDDGETGWMSLEELEKELAHLDYQSSHQAMSAVAEPTAPPTAASMVVANQQAMQHACSANVVTSTAGINNPNTDAWSLSFQKFSAAALEQDFLQADSARKQQQQQQPPPPGIMPPGLDLSSMIDYNLDEEQQQPVLPPPGIPTDPGQQVLSQTAARLMEQLEEIAATSASEQQPAELFTGALSAPPPPEQEQLPAQLAPIPKPFPITPHNSIAMGPQFSMVVPPAMMGVVPPTPPPSAAITPNCMTPRTGMVALPPGSIPVAVPVLQRAWQSPPPRGPLVMQHQQEPPRVFCNPHPRAPTIPATALVSKYMNARDIAYVVHGILRHVSAAGASSVDDYDVQYWVRRNGTAAAEQVVVPANNTATSPAATTGREEKAKEWSTEHATLGHVVRSHVSRPRALIAQPVTQGGSSSSSSSEQKQRATLWKARIYVDQAYQAYSQVIVLWKQAPPGQVPVAVQTHLLKLLKCMGLQKVAAAAPASGISEVDIQHQQQQEYTVTDPQAIQLLLKLDKGKVLMSRVLEQALLPPKAVQAALPVLLQVLCDAPPPDANTTTHSNSIVLEDAADSRLFVILARVVQSLPDLSPNTLLQSLQAVEQRSAAALSTTTRMQCVHALLQRGGRVAATTTDASFQEEWNKMEQIFMQILARM